MKKNEKMVIGVLLLITIVLVIVGVKLRNNKGTQVASSNNKNNYVVTDVDTEEENEKVPSLDEENIAVLEDGTRYNTSEVLKKEKKLDGLTVTDIQLTEKENQTILLGTVTNNTGSVRGGYYVDVTLLDKEGKEMTVLSTYLRELKAGESEQLNTQATLDYANAYDFKITKQ